MFQSVSPGGGIGTDGTVSLERGVLLTRRNSFRTTWSTCILHISVRLEEEFNQIGTSCSETRVHRQAAFSHFSVNIIMCKYVCIL